MRFSKLGFGAAVVMAGVCLAGSAFAQEAEAGGEVGMTLPGAAPAGQARATEGDSDHDQMIGRFAVGYLGARSVPIADASTTSVGNASVQAPVIGLRYWLDQTMGLDAGIGFFSSSGSTKIGNQSTDKAGVNAVLVHAGIPFSLTSEKHFSFQIVPEVNIGFAQQTWKDRFAANDELVNKGFMLDVGARAGAELHFGFIGVPQLSLQGSIGALFSMQQRSATYTPPSGASTDVEDTTTEIKTAVYDNPWNIFTSNVAALYYF